MNTTTIIRLLNDSLELIISITQRLQTLTLLVQSLITEHQEREIIEDDTSPNHRFHAG